MSNVHTKASTSFFQLVVCRPQPGVSAEDVASLSHELQGWVVRQPGLVRRSLVACSDGSYVDIIEWADPSAAEAASKAADHPDASRMQRVLALDSMTFFQGSAIPSSS